MFEKSADIDQMDPKEQSDLCLHCFRMFHSFRNIKIYGVWYTSIVSTFYIIKRNNFCDILEGGGQVVRRCWLNFQCRGFLLIWMIVGQGPIALAVGACGVAWTFFLVYLVFFLLPSLEDSPI